MCMNDPRGTTDGDFRSDMVDQLCQFKPLFLGLFVFEITVILLGLFALPFNEPGSPERLVLLLTFALVTMLLVSTVAILYRCRTVS